MTVKKEVLRNIERSKPQMVDFLRHYLRYRSINYMMAQDQGIETEVEKCQNWLTDRLIEWNLFDKVDCWSEEQGSKNVVATLRGKSRDFKLMFNGHSDVVPVTLEQMDAWDPTLGPWEAKMKDNEIWGRGAADMKAGNVAAIFALKSIAEIGDRLNDGVILALVSTEENGGHKAGVDAILNRGYKTPFCILPEPTNMAITPQILGEFYFQLVIKGEATHICRRHLCVHPSSYMVKKPGVNAIDKARKILNALEDLEQEWGIYQKSQYMPPGSMTLNISIIRGGSNFSALADSCEIIGSVLFNPELHSQEVIQELKDVINGIIKGDYWLREHPPTLKIPYILDVKEPVNVPDDHELMRILKQNFRHIMQKDPKIIASVGTSDANYLNKQGVLTLQLGVEEYGIHGKNEKVSVESMYNLSKIFALTILDTCGIK